ncbi:MAG: hypothetical protein QXJ07_03335, partial [Candidatus Bathyarchaeia archaeon]
LRRHAGWVRFLKETLMNENALIYKYGFLNKDYVVKIIEDHFGRRKRNGEKIAFLIALEIFLRIFGQDLKNLTESPNFSQYAMH